MPSALLSLDIAVAPKIKDKGIRQPLQPNRQHQQQQPSTSMMPPIDLTEDEPPKTLNASASKITKKRKPRNTAQKTKNTAKFSK